VSDRPDLAADRVPACGRRTVEDDDDLEADGPPAFDRPLDELAKGEVLAAIGGGQLDKE